MIAERVKVCRRSSHVNDEKFATRLTYFFNVEVGFIKINFDVLYKTSFRAHLVLLLSTIFAQ